MIQKKSCNRVLEKTRTRTFYFKNVRYTDCVELQKGKTKQTTVSSNSVSLARKRVACEENARGLKIIQI